MLNWTAEDTEEKINQMRKWKLRNTRGAYFYQVHLASSERWAEGRRQKADGRRQTSDIRRHTVRHQT